MNDTIGKIQFDSSLSTINHGFSWAKGQALFYAHNGEDPVGLWYEAALPGREAFCMRDVSHQVRGAAALGLSEHTKNMLLAFAKNISLSKDYCTYWEITKDGLPCPDDYDDDHDFWYNLPGSFEIIRACYEQYLWTGDEDYLTNPIFTEYYRMTCNEYVQQWDKDSDGILEHYSHYGRRGIASYNECDVEILAAGDMLASQYAAYRVYSKMLRLRGHSEEAKHYQEMEQNLKSIYLEEWYQEKEKKFYGARNADGSFYEEYYKEGNFLPLYFGILDREETMEAALEQLKQNGASNVEAATYLPEIYYEHGEEEEGYVVLCYLCNPELERKEYPEVSYAVVGTVVNQLMGIQVMESGEIRSCSHLPSSTDWALLSGITVKNCLLDIRHDGRGSSTIVNHSQNTLRWRADFAGNYASAMVNGQQCNPSYTTDKSNRRITYVTVELLSNQEVTVQAGD